MDSLRRFILSMFAVFVALSTSILVMIKGWGVKPQSWWWIIGVYLLGHIFTVFLVELAKAK